MKKVMNLRKDISGESALTVEKRVLWLTFVYDVRIRARYMMALAVLQEVPRIS
jgi:hypothetical protein